MIKLNVASRYRFFTNLHYIHQNINQLFTWEGLSVTPNGSAIWGGCVTRRHHRAGPWYFSHKAVTVQALPAACLPVGRAGREGMARVFAVMVQIIWRAGAIAVQV
jgi:hypothetical protein